MGCFLDPRQDLTSLEKQIFCMLFLMLTREFVNLYGLGLVLDGAGSGRSGRQGRVGERDK